MPVWVEQLLNLLRRLDAPFEESYLLLRERFEEEGFSSPVPTFLDVAHALRAVGWMPGISPQLRLLAGNLTLSLVTMNGQSSTSLLVTARVWEAFEPEILDWLKSEFTGPEPSYEDFRNSLYELVDRYRYKLGLDIP